MLPKTSPTEASEKYEPLVRALLDSAPDGELLTDTQIETWLGIPKGTQASQRKSRSGWLWQCTIYLGPRSPRAVKSKVVALLPTLIGKGWAGA